MMMISMTMMKNLFLWFLADDDTRMLQISGLIFTRSIVSRPVLQPQLVINDYFLKNEVRCSHPTRLLQNLCETFTKEH